jgi:hypothetical protein
MSQRNRTTYRAELSQLRLQAFGVDQIIELRQTIEIYQARVSPELWRARPSLSRGLHKWEAASADALMKIITDDFVELVDPWTEWQYDARDYQRKPGRILRRQQHRKSA